MIKNNQVRPEIAKIPGSAELRRWYWLKVELAAEARRLAVKCTGAKFTILERLSHYHDTGERVWPGDKSAKTTKSTKTLPKFDWHSAALDVDTVITDSYKSTQNVRRFFEAQLGPGFKFNIEFMAWLKASTGETLGDAVRFWQAQQASPVKAKIQPHNQFNQYARDFMADNPGHGMKDARKYWARKKLLPTESGRHRYEPSDLNLTD